jgi:hypothetical protein
MQSPRGILDSEIQTRHSQLRSYLRSLAAHRGLAFVNYASFAIADLLLDPATLRCAW